MLYPKDTIFAAIYSEVTGETHTTTENVIESIAYILCQYEHKIGEKTSDDIQQVIDKVNKSGLIYSHFNTKGIATYSGNGCYLQLEQIAHMFAKYFV